MTTTFRRTAMVAAMTLTYAPASAQNPVVPQTTGSIAGTVRDRVSRQPIENVNVFVEGTTYGALTKASGQYAILGLPPGTYTLVARRMDMATIEIANVVVSADVKRPLDIEMAATGKFYYPTDPPMRIEQGQVTPPRAEQGVLPQNAVVCGTGPAQMGISTLQGASMSITQSGGGLQILSFQAEPVVVDVPTWSAFRPGDVIQSVNGDPITTRAGAERFSNPSAGEHLRVTIRRGGERVEVHLIPCNRPYSPGQVGFPSSRMLDARASDTIRMGAGSGAEQGSGIAAGRGRGGRGGGGSSGTSAGATSTPPTISPLRPRAYVTVTHQDSTARVTTTEARALAADILHESMTHYVNFVGEGVMLRCTTPCLRALRTDGNPYWRFSRPPAVVAPQNSAMPFWKDSGLEQNDVITTVNGHASTSEAGSALLTHASLVLPLQLELTRNGERKKVTVKRQEQGSR